MVRSVQGMDATHSIALDLVSLELDDREALVRLLADHAVAPARRAWGLPLPEPGERLADVLGSAVRIGNRLAWFGPTPGLTVATTLFDAVVRGYVLFTRVLPGVLADPDHLDTSLGAPNWIYFEESRQLCAFLWDDLERLVDGLLGRPTVPGENPALERRYRIERHDAALAEVADAQALARAVLATPDPGGAALYRRHDVGLRAVDQAAAFRLDDVLRAEAHQRAVWLAEVDLLFPLAEVVASSNGQPRFVPPSDPDAFEEQVDDHGVYPTVIPETIRAVVALDLVSTFSRQRSVSLCAHCLQPLLLTGHQAGRVDRGLPVYHAMCNPAHRRRWMRDYQRGRRAGRPSRSRAARSDRQADTPVRDDDQATVYPVASGELRGNV
jgi:hypothetical protein